MCDLLEALRRWLRWFHARPWMPTRHRCRWPPDRRWSAIRLRMWLYQRRRLRRRSLWTPFDGRFGMVP